MQSQRFHPRLRVMDESEVGRPHARMRLKNIVQGQMDARVQPRYDFFSTAINNACVAWTLFAIPLGQSVTPTGGTAVTKTLYHTNNKAAGQLEAPTKLLVKNVSLVGRPDMTVMDQSILNGQHVVSFHTLSKEFWVGHGQKLPAGGGVFASGAGGSTMTLTQLPTSNGWPSAQNVAPITDPVPDIPGYPPIQPITGVLLEQGQPFDVIVDPTLTGTGVGATTQNTTTTFPGYASVGIIAWVYLEGITLVAIV
jgi:hypothetical protein